ncbi:MAG: thioredoxin family protein, partial [Chloroflexi bacterium]|nr:thioredoxin family protein [Chloroflexota bacterium]
MALENPGITADVVEAQEFPALAQRYGVTSVPRTLINGRVQIKGAVAEQEFLNKVLEAAGQKPAAALLQP